MQYLLYRQTIAAVQTNKKQKMYLLHYVIKCKSKVDIPDEQSVKDVNTFIF